jgi:hypothetical protein
MMPGYSQRFVTDGMSVDRLDDELVGMASHQSQRGDAPCRGVGKRQEMAAG